MRAASCEAGQVLADSWERDAAGRRSESSAEPHRPPRTATLRVWMAAVRLRLGVSGCPLRQFLLHTIPAGTNLKPMRMRGKMKILTVVGARPNFMKAGPILAAICDHN